VSYWRNRKVLVTGGAGFIGSNLVERLVELGARVRVCDGLERGRLENLRRCLDEIEFLNCDLTDSDNCDRSCQGMEVAVHLAAKVGGIGYYLSRAAEVMAHNVLVDTLMWQAAEAQGLQRYLYASSAHVYPLDLQGSPDAPPMEEEQAVPADPPLSYGWAKLLGEKQLEYGVGQGSRVRVAVLRLIGVYGPNQDIDLASGSAIPVFIRRAVRYPWGQPFRILGTGEETRSYCYVSDVVEAMLLALERLDGQRLIGPLNVGSEERVRIADLAQEIIAISGRPIETEFDLSHRTAIWGQVLDSTKARDLLGWTPSVSLRDGLQRTYDDIEQRLKGETAPVASTRGGIP
jgi:GDP-D-mannose 3',5'-epimerase